jgi:hypothetical protein
MTKTELRLTFDVIDDGVLVHRQQDRIDVQKYLSQCMGYMLSRVLKDLRVLECVGNEHVIIELIIAEMFEQLESFDGVAAAIRKWDKLADANLKHGYPELAECMVVSIDESKFPGAA